MYNKKKNETEGLDKYLRLFPKVMRIEITLLQKYILCDIISRKIQGQPYYKTSSTLAEELGTYKKKTIQTAFQWLETNGYINTKPYNDGKHKDDLREAEVIQMEKWIYTDDHLQKIGFKIMPNVKKVKDDNYAWAKKKRKVKDVAPLVLESSNGIHSIESEPIRISMNEIPSFENEYNKDLKMVFHKEHQLINSKIEDEVQVTEGIVPITMQIETIIDKNKESLNTNSDSEVDNSIEVQELIRLFDNINTSDLTISKIFEITNYRYSRKINPEIFCGFYTKLIEGKINIEEFIISVEKNKKA